MDTPPILSIHRPASGPVSITTIVAALRTLGGSAHQDAIVDLIAGALHAAKTDIARQVETLLASHPETSRFLQRAFGPESRRWTLTHLAWQEPHLGMA